MREPSLRLLALGGCAASYRSGAGGIGGNVAGPFLAGVSVKGGTRLSRSGLAFNTTGDRAGS